MDLLSCIVNTLHVAATANLRLFLIPVNKKSSKKAHRIISRAQVSQDCQLNIVSFGWFFIDLSVSPGQFRGGCRHRFVKSRADGIPRWNLAGSPGKFLICSILCPIHCSVSVIIVSPKLTAGALPPGAALSFPGSCQMASTIVKTQTLLAWTLTTTRER